MSAVLVGIDTMGLSENEQKRYARQMMMDGWGEEIQRKIKRSTVFIAGAGGLGSPVSIYPAVAGVGNIKICDFDSPDWSNLNRQILHDHTRIGTNKAVSGKMTLERLNSDVTVTAFHGQDRGGERGRSCKKCGHYS